MQEAIALVVFPGFVFVSLHQLLRWNHLIRFGLIFAALYPTFLTGVRAAVPKPHSA